MATISENLQILKDSTDAIKQAIIDKGGTISGDITTWADAISGIENGTSSKELLLFKINSLEETRLYESGMSFGEWIESVYSNSSLQFREFYISNGNIVTTNLGYLYETNEDRNVLATDRIHPILYIINNQSGGAD